MSPIQAAQAEWEAATTFHKLHVTHKILRHEFRRFGDAVAVLDWQSSDGCLITFIEALPESRGGDASKLLGLLKNIADRYGIYIWGNATPYEPIFGTKKKLCFVKLAEWYERNGFAIDGAFYYPKKPS